MNKLFLSLLLGLGCVNGTSQVTGLDPSFGKGGIVRTDFTSPDIIYDNQCQEILLGTDGSFYLVFEMNAQTLVTHRLVNGNIDLQYGENGYSVPVSMKEPRAAIQTDGKIVLGGTAGPSNGTDFVLARMNTDGSLDASFSGDGKTTTDFQSTRDRVLDIVLQSDGKILAVGGAYDNVKDRIAMARYNTDGSPDLSFSDDGKQITTLWGAAEAIAVAVQTDGKIITAGYSNDGGVYSMAVLRYLTNGTLDSSFSGDGLQKVTSGWYSIAKTAVIQKDGKLLIGGYTLNSSNVMRFMLARFNADGSFDTSFSGDGIEISNFGGGDAVINAMRLQQDGRIVVSGFANTTGHQEFIVGRYLQDGSFDHSFSGDGIDVPDLSLDPLISVGSSSSLVIRPDGKIMIAGTYLYSMAYAVACYNADGSLDRSFAVEGILKDHKPAGRTAFNASAVQPDGKIIVAGTAEITRGQPGFAIARYTTDGQLDTSFSGDGMLVADFGLTSAEATALAIQADGKIVVAGSSFDGQHSDFAVARLNPDGSFDNGFSGDGKLLTHVGYDNGITSMVIQPDGKILVAGFSNISGTGNDFALARYNGDGSLDTGFSGDGLMTTDFGSINDEVVALLLQPDKKIIAIGNTNSIEFAFARYNPDGTLDTTFSGDGLQITGLEGRHNKATSAVLQMDGAFVVAGIIENDALMARFRSNGSLDTSFSGDGYIRIDFGQSTVVPSSLLLESNGKFIVGGTLFNGGLADFALLRMNEDGTTDKSFGTDGALIMDLGYGGDYINSLSSNGNRFYVAGRTDYGGQSGVLAAFLNHCEVSLTLPDVLALDRGVDANTVYPGYAPASKLTMTAIASGGVSPYTYNWTHGASTASITVSPLMPTTYSVTVTDAMGCRKTASKLVNVVDVHCGNGMDKIAVCQVPPGKPANAGTLCISANAVASHLNQGSYLGNCRPSSMSEQTLASKLVDDYTGEVSIYPNPSQSSFTFSLSAFSQEKVSIVIRDDLGRIIEKKTIGPAQHLELGASYKPGLYFAEVIQGDKRIVKKLLKLIP